MHATLPCTACHINNVFKGTPASCYACHQADFIGSNNPPHVQLGLPQDCGIATRRPTGSTPSSITPCTRTTR
jgi:hypothetical protein